MAASENNPNAPSSFDEAIAVARALMSLADEARAKRLARLEADSGDTTEWTGIVRELVDPPPASCGPRVVALLRHLESLGVPRDRAKTDAAELVAKTGCFEAWSDWMNVVDRDELRLRLEALSRTETWSESLVDFITFYFRASVSDLYQAAAVALGRHLCRSDGLRAYLARFAEQRSVSLDQPLMLNGSRTMRRLLIALSAARGAEVDGLNIAPEPLPVTMANDGRESVIIPNQSADLFALLLAMELALRYDADQPRIRRLVDGVLERVPHLPAAIISRTVIQRFGCLLVLRNSERTIDLWSNLYASLRSQFQSLHHDDFAQRVSLLTRIDEMLRTIANLSNAAAQALGEKLMRESAGDERRFLRVRLLAWCDREHRTLPPWRQVIHDAYSTDGRPPTVHDTLRTGDVLELFDRNDAAAPHGAPPEPDMLHARFDSSRQAQCIGRLLSALSSQPTWLSHDDAARALMSMLLIDQLQNSRVPASQLAMLMARSGFRTGGEREVDASADGSSREPSEATTLVLLRLLGWEAPGTEQIIDTGTLHRIDDLRMLLALVPTARRSPLLPILADAFEHQVRLRLRTEPGFSPEAFLALIRVRRPYRGLFTAMAAVCEGRTYTRSGGGSVPLHDLVMQIIAEYDEAKDANGPAHPPEETGAGGAFTRHAQRLHDRMLALREQTLDLRTRLVDLAELIGDAPPNHVRRSGTIFFLLAELYRSNSDAAVLQHGYPAWTEYTFNELQTLIAGQCVNLRAFAHALMPDDWTAGDRVHEAVDGVRRAIRSISDQLSRALPDPFDTRLERLITAIDAQAAAWGGMIEDVLDRWPEERLHPEKLNLERCNEALSDVMRIEHPLLREHLLGLLWQSLRAWAADGADDPWLREKALLDWGVNRVDLGTAYGGAWRDALVKEWCDLLDGAMHRQEERRVRDLIENDRYGPLRVLPPAADVLQPAARWCLDRYLLKTARRARSDIASGRNLSGPGPLQMCASFVGNFTPMWIALLMGAIFMLDFGDAWSAMADPEIGDIRGITLSFIIAITGAYLYIYFNLRQRSRLSPGESPGALQRSQLARSGAFACVCLTYSLLLVTGLWWLLSRTEEVVLGAWAVGHIVVWSGFAIFVGVFLGLLAGQAGQGST